MKDGNWSARFGLWKLRRASRMRNNLSLVYISHQTLRWKTTRETLLRRFITWAGKTDLDSNRRCAWIEDGGYPCFPSFARDICRVWYAGWLRRLRIDIKNRKWLPGSGIYYVRCLVMKLLRILSHSHSVLTRTKSLPIIHLQHQTSISNYISLDPTQPASAEPCRHPNRRGSAKLPVEAYYFGDTCFSSAPNFKHKPNEVLSLGPAGNL